jgi:hypothetical protein
LNDPALVSTSKQSISADGRCVRYDAAVKNILSNRLHLTDWKSEIAYEGTVNVICRNAKTDKALGAQVDWTFCAGAAVCDASVAELTPTSKFFFFLFLLVYFLFGRSFVTLHCTRLILTLVFSFHAHLQHIGVLVVQGQVWPSPAATSRLLSRSTLLILTFDQSMQLHMCAAYRCTCRTRTGVAVASGNKPPFVTGDCNGGCTAKAACEGSTEYAADEAKVGGATALVTCDCSCHVHLCALSCCSLGGAIALVTFICVLRTLRAQISRSSCNSVHYTMNNKKNNLTINMTLQLKADGKLDVRTVTIKMQISH